MTFSVYVPNEITLSSGSTRTTLSQIIHFPEKSSWHFMNCTYQAYWIKLGFVLLRLRPFSLGCSPMKWQMIDDFQGRSQNLKAVPQNFMEVFKVDDVTAIDFIQKKQHLWRKENLQIFHSNHYCLISIFSIKLLERLEIWFSFLRE